MDMLNKGVIMSWGRSTELDDMIFHHDTQNEMQSRSYKLFISEIFHLIFQDCYLPWKTRPQIRGDYCNVRISNRGTTEALCFPGLLHQPPCG